MDFVDVIFPVNLGPLTYRCPEKFSEAAKPGMMVTAPLKNRLTKGILIGKAPAFPAGEVKEIHVLHGNEPVLSARMIDMLKWLSEYYIAEQGLVLKNMLTREAFTKTPLRRARIPSDHPSTTSGWDISKLKPVDQNGSIVTTLKQSLGTGTYKTFLFHAPSTFYEYTLLTGLLKETSNVIILVPEVSLVSTVYPLLSEQFGERVCVFHSDLSSGKRSDTFERIVAGSSDIILGTRSAVFSPLKKVSLIVVLHEHSSSYKQENSPCYHARDVAVMRGYLENSTVLLSSISPSLESFFNCESGKYHLLKNSADIAQPAFRVIDMRYEKQIRPYLSKTLIDASVRHIKHGDRVIFVSNRRGHSTLLQCTDCNYIEECPSCKIPLVFHKQDLCMKCHYCGFTMPRVPEQCRRCKGYRLQMLGAGTQKIQEELDNLLGEKTLRIDSDRTRKKSELRELTGADNKIVICTKLMTKRLSSMNSFSMAAIMNADLLLNLPDFRSAEKAYQEITSVADKINPDGEIFIQTRMPGNDLFRSIRNHDYNAFFREELNRRKSLSYPPFSRLLLLKFISKKDMKNRLSNMIKADNDLEILGPYASKNRKGEHEYKLLLRSSVRGRLHAAAKTFIEAFRDEKDIRVKVDVDPQVI